MDSQAKSVGRSGQLAALRKAYEIKAQEVLTEMVAHSTAGTLDIFTLFRLITKRIPLGALPNKRKLSAGGASPDIQFFVQAIKNFEDLRSEIKKLLRSPMLKGCLHRTAISESCEDDFLKLKEACKQIRRTIMGKLHIHDIAFTKDFVILECLTRLVQICQERQEPPVIVKSMILIWQLLKDSKLTQRFVSYKHVSEIIERLCTLCERGTDASTQRDRGSHSPVARRPPMTIADRDTQTIRSIERLVAPEHIPERPKDLEDRIKTISRRFREFSSPQQKPTTANSPRVDRSKSSQINLNLSKRFDEVNEDKEQVSVTSRLRSRSRLMDSPQHGDVQGRSGAVSDLGDSQEHSNQQPHRDFGPRSNANKKSANKSQQSAAKPPKTRQQALFAGVDDTFLSEVSGSSISFRDLASGSKRSHRVFKESAQKAVPPVDESDQVPLHTFYPPFDDPDDEGAQLSQVPPFGPRKVASRGGDSDSFPAVVSTEGQSLHGLRGPSPTVGRMTAAPSAQAGTEAVRPEESWGRPDFASSFGRSRGIQQQERWPEHRDGEGISWMPQAQRVVGTSMEAGLFGRPQAEDVNRETDPFITKVGHNITEVDSIVREVTREILAEKFQEIIEPSVASIRAKIVEAQIFSISWNDELLYDQMFENTYEGIHYCVIHSHAALSLVQDCFDLDTILKFSKLSKLAAGRRDHGSTYLGKRSQDMDFHMKPQGIINPHRFSAPIENPWSELEREELFEGFDAKRLNFHFNSRSQTQKSSREGSNSKNFRKDG